MIATPTIWDEQRKIAAELSPILRELADACEKAADGDEASRRLLDNHMDNYWFGLVIGRGLIQRLTSDEE